MALASAGFALPASATSGSGAVPTDTVSQLSTGIPDYLPKAQLTYGPLTFADPANHLLFEYDNGDAPTPPATAACQKADPNWSGISALVAVDSDTYHEVSEGCAGEYAGGNGGSNTNTPMYAVDSTDGLLFFSDGAAGNNATAGVDLNGSVAQDSIIVESERTLQVVGVWALPAGSLPDIFGLSWFAPADQLVLVTAEPQGAFFPGGAVAQGVDVSLLSIPANLATGGAAGAVFPTTAVSGCGQPPFVEIGPANPYRSPDAPYLYVPCVLSGSPRAYGYGKANAAIVRLTLDSVGAAGKPTGQTTATVVPGDLDAVLWDPGSDRAFLPYETSAADSIQVYDGLLPGFIGSVSVSSAPAGKTDPNTGCTGYALDPETGRVYMSGPAGTVTADGRSTPVQPGTTYAGLGGWVSRLEGAVLPPDQAFPFTRVIVSFVYTDGQQQAGGGNCDLAQQPSPTLPTFTVLADTTPTPVIQPTNVDNNTYAGSVPAGASVSSNYSGNAEAVGTRVVWTGSYGTALNNDTGDSASALSNNAGAGAQADGNALPLGPGVRDLLAGWVQRANLQNSSTDGTATALGDGTGTTASGVTQCSDLAALGACSNEQQLSQGASGAPDTGQAWPFLTSSCSQPGDAQTANTTAAGYYATTSRDSQGDPTLTQVPGSDQDATASTDCIERPPAGAGPTPSPSATGGPSPSPTSSVSQSPAALGAKQTPRVDAMSSPTPMPASASSPTPRPTASAGSNTGTPQTPAGSYGVLATSRVGALGLSGSGAPSVSVAYAAGAGQVSPSDGLGDPVTAQAAAIAEGVRIGVPGGVQLDIGEVSQNGDAVSTGIAGGAAGRDLTQFADVSITTPQAGTQVLCPSNCSPAQVQGMVDQINSVDPGMLQVSVPQPDAPYGTGTTNSDGSKSVIGSPGGYLAIVEASQAQQNYDKDFNDIPANDGESTLLPAMRIQIYNDNGGPNGTSEGLDRVTVDLAAVEADTEQGLTVLPAGVSIPPVQSSAPVVTSAGSGAPVRTVVVPSKVVPARPGTPARFVPGAPAQFVPGTPGGYVPGTPASTAVGSGGGSSGGGGLPLVGPVVHFVRRVLAGLAVVVRSPGAALKLLGLLVMLATPVVLIVRRRQWLAQVAGSAS